MEINLWGVRGSTPVSGPETIIYGGNTSCADVWEDGWLLILDGGSGIQKLVINPELQTKRIDVLLTHFHLDHIQGLGFFSALFNPEMEVHIWGPGSSARSLHSRLSRYLSPPLFPVLIRDLPCKLTLHDISNSTFHIGPFTIQSDFLIHPGPTVGYRISGQHAVLAYMPDHEPALGKNGIIIDRNWVSGIDLAQDADLLLHDAQYTAEDYGRKKGWGHSSIDDAGLFASLANVSKVLFWHHDPYRTDTQLNEMIATFKANTSYNYTCEMAREGTQILLK